MRMKAAVTGGSGCLGRPLVERLVNYGFDVRVLGSRSGPYVNSLQKKVHSVKGGLHSPQALRELVRDCQIVFHLAAIVHAVPKTKAEVREIFHVNVEGTKFLLEASAVSKVRRIVFYSTVGVYGQEAGFIGDELSPCRPQSPYAVSKYLAEEMVLKSIRHGGPQGVVLRFPLVYGPFDKGNMARLINAIYHRYFMYLGDGNGPRSLISARNAAEAAVKAAMEPRAASEVFCITDGRDYTLKEIVDTINYAIGRNWQPMHLPLAFVQMFATFGDHFENMTHRPFPVNSRIVKKLSGRLTFSCEKAFKILRYEPVETLLGGIVEEVQWLRAIKGWK